MTVPANYSYFDHGKLFGYESAKSGEPRKCPYKPEFTDAIRGWYLGWDEYHQLQRKPQ